MNKRLKNLLRPHVKRKHVNAYHKARAVWANLRHGFPARGLLVIGVTGTKGKTTTCHYISSILEEAGFTVGMATTVNFQIGDKRWANESNKSVLPPDQLIKLIREMKQARCNALVLEV